MKGIQGILVVKTGAELSSVIDVPSVETGIWTVNYGLQRNTIEGGPSHVFLNVLIDFHLWEPRGHGFLLPTCKGHALPTWAIETLLIGVCIYIGGYTTWFIDVYWFAEHIINRDTDTDTYLRSVPVGLFDIPMLTNFRWPAQPQGMQRQTGSSSAVLIINELKCLLIKADVQWLSVLNASNRQLDVL